MVHKRNKSSDPFLVLMKGLTTLNQDEPHNDAYYRYYSNNEIYEVNVKL